jgi:hypothetical protein
MRNKFFHPLLRKNSLLTKFTESRTMKTLVLTISLVLLIAGCDSKKSEITTTNSITSIENELTNALKNEMVVSDNGQKFYDIGSCMSLASLVYKEEVYKNDSEKKLLIAKKMVQLKNTVNLVSISEYAGFITNQKCGDMSNQSDEVFNQCAATNLNNGIKGWIQGAGAPRILIAKGQLTYEEVFDQFNLYCAQFLE